MKLYIVRHGETVWNRHHKVQGVADIPLAQNGILLAEKTGEALKNVSFDLCITSPLVRARKTAELILAKQAHKVPVKEDIRIREINFGVLEGVVCMNDAREYLDPQMKKFLTAQRMVKVLGMFLHGQKSSGRSSSITQNFRTRRS